MMVLWLLAAPAWAKKTDKPGAPEVSAGMPWMATGYAIAGLAGVCIVGFKNSKRTHLD